MERPTQAETLAKTEGEYIAYLTDLGSSAIAWSDDIDELRGLWCFGISIFLSAGLDKAGLRAKFPDKPEQGTILNYLRDNHELVEQTPLMEGIHVKKT